MCVQMLYLMTEEMYRDFPWCQRSMKSLRSEAKKKHVQLLEIADMSEIPASDSEAVVMLLCWVAAMESLGQPFLAPGSPRRTHNPDLLFRAPTFRQRLRAYLSNPEEMKRAYGRMRRFDGRKKE